MTDFRTAAGTEPVQADSLVSTTTVTGTSITASTALVGDTVSERTAGAGVTVDGLKIKDGAIPVTASAGQPLELPIEVTWETATGAVATVPAGEVWFVRRVGVFTQVAWDGTGAELDVGQDGASTDADGFIDGSAHAGMLAANGTAGFSTDEGGASLWATDHATECALLPGDTITVAVTPGTGASAGTSVIYVSGSRFVSPV